VPSASIETTYDASAYAMNIRRDGFVSSGKNWLASFERLPGYREEV
jgi:hypothetical protein